MPSDQSSTVSGLRARLRAVDTRLSKATALRDRMASEMSRKQAEIAELEVKSEQLAKVVILLRQLLDKMVDKQIRLVEDVATEGLRSVFYDQVLALEAEVTQKYNRTHIEFFIRQGAKDDPMSHRGSPLASFGGGPSSVASLALRVLAVLRLKLFPFLALDEALGAVSPEYVEPTSRFIRGLSQKMGIDTFMVTQEHSFVEHADRAYSGSSEEVGDLQRLTLRRLK